MTTEDVNDALLGAGLCWTMGPRSAQLQDVGHPWANAAARNTATLLQYKHLGDRKGKTPAELAAAIRAKHDGDPAPWQAIHEGPDV